MVRLRSDRWYSRSGQRRVRMQQRPVGGGLRRVISLAILLVMVVWVMQRSAEPEAYERIFRYLGVPLNRAETGGDAVQAFSSEVNVAEQGESVSTASSTPNSQPMFKVWDEMAWRPRDISQAARLAFASKQEEPEMTTWSQPNIELAVHIALTEHREEFEHWLDKRLIGQLTDGSPWRSTESDVFFRLLQKANQWDRANADRYIVASYPVLKESLTLQRGQEWIRFRGWIEQAKLVSPKDKSWGIDSYWTLWLRPSDQTARPVVVYVTRLPPGLQSRTTPELKGEIEVYGLPAKLMAYNAVAGVETAPTLCGVASDYFVKESAPASIAVQDASLYAWVWPALIAGLFSAFWVFWIWRSSQTVVVEEESPATAGGKKLKFVLGGANKNESNNNSAKTLLLAIALSTGSFSIAIAQAEPTVQQDSSLIASESETSVSAGVAENDSAESEASKAIQLLGTRLTEESLFEIRHYNANEPTGLNLFPNSLGRLMYTTGQLGDERLRELIARDFSGLSWNVKLWQGWVVGCDVVPLAEQQAEWMGQKQVYRLQVNLPDAGDTQEIYNLFVAQAPSQWLRQVELRQPFQAAVIDLSDHELRSAANANEPIENEGDTTDAVQTGGFKSGENLFGKIGVAASIRWMLTEAKDLQSMSPPVPSDWQRLALLGSDLTWIDLARSRQKLDLTVADRSSFYQLINAASRIDTPQVNESLGPVVWTAINGPELLARDQNQWVGRAIVVKGRIARISRVSIENKLSREMAGSEFYYEMDGFIRIEGKRIVIPPPQNASEDEPTGGRTEDLVYENEFPMTVVALELPDFLKEGEVDEKGVQHQSWSSQRWVDVRGVFFRNWSYRSEYVSRGNSKERQMAPLIVATNIKTTVMSSDTTVSPGNWVNWLAMFLIFGLLALIWGYVIADSKSKRTNQRKKNTNGQSS
jgi:hypothetical protein